MGFDGTAVDYDRFMGRYSAGLSAPFADFASVHSGQRVLDVGCGPGALTGELVARLGEGAVTGVDTSPSYVASARERFPGVHIELAQAGALPFDDADFDAVLAQLVVHFMSDPVHDLGEMARVTRVGGVVAACVWDHAGGTSPLSKFWHVLSALDPEAPREAALPGTREGQLAEYLSDAGARRHRADRAHRAGGASHIRGLVGALSAWCRAGRRIHRRTRCPRARAARTHAARRDA